MFVLMAAMIPSAYARPNLQILFEGIPVSNGTFFHVTGLDDDDGRTEHFTAKEARVLTHPSVLILRHTGSNDALTEWAQATLRGRDLPKRIIGTRNDRGSALSQRAIRGEGCSVTTWRRDEKFERFELVCETFERTLNP
jgi:hypothetical protein